MVVLHFETFFLSEISVTKDGNECSCDNVVTRQQHYFCRFLAQSFRGQWRFKRLYNNGQDIPRRCLFSSSSSTFDKSTSADPILPKNAGLLLIGSFLCPKAGKTNKSRHSMLAIFSDFCYDLKITKATKILIVVQQSKCFLIFQS